MTITATTQHTVVFEDAYDRSSLPTLNAELLYTVIHWADLSEHEALAFEEMFRNWGTWNQGAWARTDRAELTTEQQRELRNGECRTSYCIAGQVAHQADYRMMFQVDSGTGEAHAYECTPQEPTGQVNLTTGLPILRDIPNANPESIERVGQRELGLTDSEADWLFNGDNELDQVKRYANTFVIARGLPVLFGDAGVELHREFADEYHIERSRG